ncbi:CPBP family intramembrane metalloprotease [Salipaludibacillus agaradhaerens]|jgi:membrane protease YdiL (CAAX protease family)|uniref:CPBP family intramembrane glutamic endopeptidase n=1 Tax=Salipaludibacillus agaradhaerens TaxID=76935 RepID=UPI00215192AA|nr:type II CAAX endopeptidase family protein [Salipaludibacillus agaradhaerens]MCR6108573.1 CPBP family intramembrane metalloprotease [Salipaludibacillus agaradhaerens]MCR6120602.1 CPBP family intramembrane metalloprotease [Salipaludibacillus agaradhaerens]
MATTRKPLKVRQIERMKEKEYSKGYLKQKQGREEEPNSYPLTRFILIKDFFRTPDLYKAIAFFISIQIVIATIAAGIKHPEYAGALNLVALVVGVAIVTLSVRIINKRQKFDKARRRFRLSRVLLIVTVMLLALFLSTFIYNLIGITMPEQPNQSSLNSLVVVFPVVMIFTMVVVSPVTEELVFRELLPYATGPSYLSFVISSLIFIALHTPYGIMGWTSYAILASGFLYARLKDNNVYTAIAVHMIWNALTLIM